MCVKHFSKVFFYANKYNRLPKFSVGPFFNTQTVVLYLRRYATTVTSPSAVSSQDILENIRGYGRPFFIQYLLTNSDKYCVVNTDQFNLEEEKNFKSLKLLRTFLDSSQDTEISNEFLECLEKELKTYGLEEICKFIMLTAEHKDSTKILEPLKYFNTELLHRKFSHEDMLKILFVVRDKRFRVPRQIALKFTVKFTMKLGFNIHSLSSKQIVQLFSWLPKLHPEFLRKVKFPMQLKLLEILPELNVEELAIITEGFSRASLTLTHGSLGLSIINKTVEEIENMYDFVFGRICKFFQIHLKLKHADSLLNFQEKVVPHISKFNGVALLHLLTSGSQLRCVHLSLRDYVADHCKRNIKDYKVREIERIVYATTIYNIQDEELLNLAVENFKEKIAVKKDYNCLIQFLYNLIHHNMYPEDLLGLILSENFISESNPRHWSINTKYMYCFIHSCVELDRPTHNFRLLNTEERIKMYNVFKLRALSDSRLFGCHTSKKSSVPVLEDLFGKNTVCLANYLPHCEPGLVMKFDKNLKAQTFENHSEFRNYHAKKASNNDHLSLFIMVVPRNYFLYNEDTPIFQTQTYIRQIKALGHIPILIKLHDWVHEKKNGNLSNFLRNVIYKNLE